MGKEQNVRYIMVVATTKYLAWVNDFAIEVKKYGYQMAVWYHEIPHGDQKNYIEKCLRMCKHIIFVFPREKTEGDWMIQIRNIIETELRKYDNHTYMVNGNREGLTDEELSELMKEIENK